MTSQKSEDLKEDKYLHLVCRISELFTVIRIATCPNYYRGISNLCQADASWF